MERKKVTPVDIQMLKRDGKKITMLSIYDYPMALLADRAGIDSILVGDSLEPYYPLGQRLLRLESGQLLTMPTLEHRARPLTAYLPLV